MSENTLPPFRADHVGSLLRPAALMQARADHKAGKIDADALRAAEDDAIRGAIKLQHDVGLKAATDGEFRRHSWHMDFILQLGGVSQGGGEAPHVQFKNEEGAYDYAPPAMAIDGTITLRDTIFKEAFAFLRDNADGQVPKITIPSPSMVHYRGGNSSIDSSVYPDLDQFWTDLSGAYAQELKGLYDLGARYIQLDDTSLAYVNDPE